MEEFEDIRPYRDEEVPAVVQRLVDDRDFVAFLGRYDSPRLSRLVPWLVEPIARRRLKGVLGNVTSIASFQHLVADYVRRIIDTTMTSFTFEGIDRLPRDRSFVFISNHRDIAGDSMLVDYALHRSGRDTVRIAVGDNLIAREFATHLMKLNKGFFIKRAEVGTKKIYAALLNSSEFIHRSLAEDQSVWIAQAEGRAKDAMDVTDPAVLKMLTLAERKRPFGDVIGDLGIVPVSISYEYDPCDVLKARELHALRTEGAWRKPAGADLVSLATGLGGFKGRVSLTFADVLPGGFDNADAVAAEIDQKILGALQLFPINFLALRTLAQKSDPAYAAALEGLRGVVDVPRDGEFERRLSLVPEELTGEWLRMYANPILNKLQHGLEVQLPQS